MQLFTHFYDDEVIFKITDVRILVILSGKDYELTVASRASLRNMLGNVGTLGGGEGGGENLN